MERGDLGGEQHVDRGTELKSLRTIRVPVGSDDFGSGGDLVCRLIQHVFAEHPSHRRNHDIL